MTTDWFLYAKCLAVSLLAMFGVCGCVIDVAESVRLFAMMFVAALYFIGGCVLVGAIVLAILTAGNRNHETN